jgi:hypothetical protein
LGVGFDSDTYYEDNSTSNSNVLPGQANSTTTRGTANFTSPVVAYEGVVEHLGPGTLTFVADFMAPNSGNLSTGSIATVTGFAALDQKAVGTGFNAGFYAAAQTACGGCYGFYSAPNNNDLFGNVTFTSLVVNGGGIATLSGGLSASGPVTAGGALQGAGILSTGTIRGTANSSEYYGVLTSNRCEIPHNLSE